MHEQIEKVYREQAGMDAPRNAAPVKELARRLRLPRWKVTAYAIAQGWIATQKKQPDWSEEEILILERHGHKSLAHIRAALRKRGYHRSLTGIQLKRKRMRIPANLHGQSARQLADCLGVDDHFVLRAINSGRLHALRRGTARTEKQGGDIWFVKDFWVRKYLMEHIAEVDIRKVDKYWLVDVLTERGE